jgi:hypothetical protein
MQITVDVSLEQAKFLQQFLENQHEGARDNLGTRKPIHLVQTMMEETVMDGGESGEKIFIVDDYGYPSYKSITDFVREHDANALSYEDAKYTEVNDTPIWDEKSYCEAYDLAWDGISIASKREVPETVAYFFTLTEAKRYMEYQKHNLRNPRTYTVGGGYGNNGDYEPFWDLLMAMAAATKEKTEKEQ